MLKIAITVESDGELSRATRLLEYLHVDQECHCHQQYTPMEIALTINGSDYLPNDAGDVLLRLSRLDCDVTAAMRLDLPL
jgi:hypothetical protein